MRYDVAVQRMLDVAALRHLSYSTEKSYVSWFTRYFRWVVKNRVGSDHRENVERFLTGMAHDELSASSQNQAFNALLFFFRECMGLKLENINALRAKKSVRQRYAPTFDEVRRLLEGMKDEGGYPCKLIVRLIYGCGLRVNEPLNLRIKDVQLEDSLLVIRQAKGDKDRVVHFPCEFSEPLKAQLVYAASVSARDAQAGLPVKLPGHLEKKYPRLAFAKEWAYVFPGLSPCEDPRNPGRKVRYHMLDENVQRAVRATVRRLDLPPMISPHCLRHGFATHAMKQGNGVRDIQAVMGHNSLETTMGYLHPEADRVVSPISSMSLAPI